MDAVQIDMFAELEKVSDSRKPNLCRSWKNAILNGCGVYIDNRVDIVVYKTTKRFYPRIAIHSALNYPKVFYSFSASDSMAGGGCAPGKGSLNFDVHEHAANVSLMVEHDLMDFVKFIGAKDITDKMVDECIEKFREAIDG